MTRRLSVLFALSMSKVFDSELTNEFAMSPLDALIEELG
jgi:hypothetical protein